jgi:MSHA biogenesis protein MshO
MSARGNLTMRSRQAGFTLIELVVAIVVSSIVVSFMAMFIVGPVNAYTAQARRAELVDAADAALRTMGRDIRRALPNSVRATNVRAIEMLATIDATRYRAATGGAASADELDFASSDTQFGTIGKFDDITRGIPYTTFYLSIYNVGVTGANAYDMTNVITPRGTRITFTDSPTTPGEDRVDLNFATTTNPNFRFLYGSPARRVYLVSGPVTYLCDATERTLKRYSNYTIQATQLLTDVALVTAGATISPIANDVEDCAFAYAAGTAQRAGLVTLDISLARDVTAGSTERIRLLNQLHIENVP